MGGENVGGGKGREGGREKGGRRICGTGGGKWREEGREKGERRIYGTRGGDKKDGCCTSTTPRS